MSHIFFELVDPQKGQVFLFDDGAVVTVGNNTVGLDGSIPVPLVYFYNGTLGHIYQSPREIAETYHDITVLYIRELVVRMNMPETRTQAIAELIGYWGFTDLVERLAQTQGGPIA